VPEHSKESMLSNRIHRLTPPPRPVPLPVICSAMFGFSGSFGALFLILGLIGTLVFTRGLHPIDELRLALSQTNARGAITKVSGTDASEKDAPVYEYEFVFTTRREEKVTGRSYFNGARWSVGESVTIEYVPDEPSITRIQGARISLFSPSALIILIFPAVGAFFFVSAAIRGWRQVILLRHGRIADARILSSRPTNMLIDDAHVVEYFFEIRTSAGDIFHGSSKALPSGRIGDEKIEPALYLPSNPNRSTLVDAVSLDYPLDVDGPSGQWFSKEGSQKVARYILAWAAVIFLTGCVLLNMFGVFR
jgi:hypothetical protein